MQTPREPETDEPETEQDDGEPTYCTTCWGEGCLSAAEYECDWVNFSPDEYIDCPDCGGSGVQ